MSYFDLTGKACLVTGGNRGIGYGMAEGLARAGAHVAIWGRDEAQNRKALDAINAHGSGDAHAWRVDVSDENAVVEAMKAFADWKGRVDCVIANAGMGRGAPSYREMDTEAWRANFKVNVDGVFWTFREACKYMVEQAEEGEPGGSLVAVSSMVATMGLPRNQGYAATKGALLPLVYGVAVEHARWGIRCNAVMPGWVATEMTDLLQNDPKFGEKVMTRVPARRWGKPADFGGVAVYLASDLSAYHTGDTLVIDGGYTKF